MLLRTGKAHNAAYLLPETEASGRIFPQDKERGKTRFETQKAHGKKLSRNGKGVLYGSFLEKGQGI